MSKVKNKAIFEEEIENVPYSLPEGWRWVRLKDIVKEIKSGFSCSKKYETTRDRGIPHLRPNNIGYFNKLDLSKIVYIPSESFDIDKYNLLAGDILFNNTNSKELVGRAVVLKEDFKGSFSNHITRIRVKKDIIPEFLSWILNLYWLKGEFLRISNKWIGQAGINNKMLKQILIPLPFKNNKPDPEKQKQIVEKIETIFEELDKAIMLRQKTLENTKKLFESVLNKIFKEAENDKDNWKWVKLENIVSTIKGKKPKNLMKKNLKNSLPYLTADYFREKTLKQFGLLEENLKVVEENDLVMIWDGSKSGDIFISDTKGILASTMVKLILKQENLFYKYLFYIFKNYFEELNKNTTGSGIPHVSKDVFNNLLIPIPFKNNQPDLEKQKQIAEYLDNLHNKIKQLEELQQIQLEKFKELKESILNKAFRGGLI